MASSRFNRTAWPPSGAHRDFLDFLDGVHRTHGCRSLRAIGKAMHLSYTRVHDIVRGVSLPVSEDQARALVTAFGEGVDEGVADRAVALFVAARRSRDLDDDPGPGASDLVPAERAALPARRPVPPAVVIVQAPRPRRGGRRVAAVLALVCATALVTVAVTRWSGAPSPAAPPPVAPRPVPTAAGPAVLAWADLPPFTAGPGEQLYHRSFARRSRDWPERADGKLTSRVVEGAYDLHVTATGTAGSVAAPTAAAAGDEVVSATAAIVSGQGVWGVWCRGTDPAGSARYGFELSHAGAVRITEPDGAGTGWVYVQGVDVSRPTTLAARCADVAGSPVQLTLALNGRVALTYRPTGPLLGPGSAGVTAWTFSDVAGPTITARLTAFDITRPPVPG